MINGYLLTYKDETDDSIVSSLKNGTELIDFIDFLDVYSHVGEYTIYAINGLDAPIKCHYAGWQPNCLIEIIRDDTNEVILRGYGEDH